MPSRVRRSTGGARLYARLYRCSMYSLLLLDRSCDIEPPLIMQFSVFFYIPVLLGTEERAECFVGSP